MVVYAGVDYAQIRDAAEKEADVILWDGGNNDWPFFRPDLEIVLVDPHVLVTSCFIILEKPIYDERR